MRTILAAVVGVVITAGGAADQGQDFRAVFTALREVIPDEELRDITDQLPTEYDALLLGRSTYS